jgi:hypothetical protein
MTARALKAGAGYRVSCIRAKATKSRRCRGVLIQGAKGALPSSFAASRPGSRHTALWSLLLHRVGTPRPRGSRGVVAVGGRGERKRRCGKEEGRRRTKEEGSSTSADADRREAVKGAFIHIIFVFIGLGLRVRKVEVKSECARSGCVLRK